MRLQILWVGSRVVHNLCSHRHRQQRLWGITSTQYWKIASQPRLPLLLLQFFEIRSNSMNAAGHAVGRAYIVCTLLLYDMQNLSALL
jgi:hypothetical protein